jgi:hypothetical protein
MRPEKNGFRLLNAFGASNRIDETDPPASGFRINLHKVAGNRCGHIPLFGCHVREQRERQGLRCASYPLAQSLPEPSPRSRTFLARYIRCKQGRAFANRFSREWRLLKKDKKRLFGHPNDQQESRRHESQHYERPEMTTLRLPAQWAFFFHGLAAGSRSGAYTIPELGRTKYAAPSPASTPGQPDAKGRDSLLQ